MRPFLPPIQSQRGAVSRSSGWQDSQKHVEISLQGLHLQQLYEVTPIGGKLTLRPLKACPSELRRNTSPRSNGAADWPGVVYPPGAICLYDRVHGKAIVKEIVNQQQNMTKIHAENTFCLVDPHPYHPMVRNISRIGASRTKVRPVNLKLKAWQVQIKSFKPKKSQGSQRDFTIAKRIITDMLAQKQRYPQGRKKMTMETATKVPKKVPKFYLAENARALHKVIKKKISENKITNKRIEETSSAKTRYRKSKTQKKASGEVLLQKSVSPCSSRSSGAYSSDFCASSSTSSSSRLTSTSSYSSSTSRSPFTPISCDKCPLPTKKIKDATQIMPHAPIKGKVDGASKGKQRKTKEDMFPCDLIPQQATTKRYDTRAGTIAFRARPSKVKLPQI